jgi:hypothetical protein
MVGVNIVSPEMVKHQWRTIETHMDC